MAAMLNIVWHKDAQKHNSISDHSRASECEDAWAANHISTSQTRTCVVMYAAEEDLESALSEIQLDIWHFPEMSRGLRCAETRTEKLKLDS